MAFNVYNHMTFDITFIILFENAFIISLKVNLLNC